MPVYKLRNPVCAIVFLKTARDDVAPFEPDAACVCIRLEDWIQRKTIVHFHCKTYTLTKSSGCVQHAATAWVQR